MKCNFLHITQISCRGGIRPFVSSFKSDKEIEEAKKVSSNFDANKDTRTKAQKKAYEREQDARRRANDEKKMFARYKATMPEDDMYKTLGAFRRGKRSNSSKFQKLQSEYRSIAQRNSSV